VAKQDKAEATEGRVFTRIGSGPNPARVVKVHGMDFILGKVTPVNDPALVKILEQNPTFVEGEVAEEDLTAQMDAAGKAEDEQRKADKILNSKVLKQYGKE